jgi:hypothetical protein
MLVNRKHGKVSKEMAEPNIEVRISDTLHERATRDVPYELNLWPRISSRVEKRHSAYRSASRLPFARPNLIVAAYLAVLVLAVVVTFSLAPSLKSTVQPEVISTVQQNPTDVAISATQQASEHPQITPWPSLTPDATATRYTAEYNASRAPYAYLDRTKYGKYIGIPQTGGGYTVTINWMYVDGNRLLIDFDVLVPEGTSDSQRLIRPYVYALSVKDGPDLPTSGMQMYGKAEGNRYHQLVERDVANILDAYGSQELDFNVAITVDAVVIRSKAQGVPPDATAIWVADGGEIEHIRERNVAGPFYYRVSVPFIPARIARPLQTADTNNVGLSLQQFRVSPSEVRSYIEVDSLDESITPVDWVVSASAQVNDWDALMFRTGRPPYGQLLTSKLGVHTIYDNVYDEQGAWTFTVRKLLNNQTQEIIDGPWVFKFEVPPATPAKGNGYVLEPTPIRSR